MIIFEVKKLTSIAIKAPTPNQKTKKPTVIISQIKNIPDAINHICHIVKPPIFVINTILLYYKFYEIQRDLIKPGLNVYVTNYNSDGIVMSNISKDDKVQVQIGAMKLKVDIKYLQEKVSSSKNTNNYSYTGRNNLKSQSVSPEINLLGLTVDEAVPLVDKYLDDCFMAKLSPVRIVHGKGTGALRNGIHKYLKTNKYVDSYRMGTFGEGEMGVTIVTLKIK